MNETCITIVNIKETALMLADIAADTLKCVEVQAQHADTVKALQAAIKQLETERVQTAKQLAAQKASAGGELAALRVECDKLQAERDAIQEAVAEAKRIIAKGQVVDKELARIRAKFPLPEPAATP
jgi:isopropylmalate/homocitrate/citramalate synthase